MSKTIKHYESVAALLQAPRSNYFWVQKEGETYTFGHPQSYYATGSDPGLASFDIGNNKVLMNVAPEGRISSLTFFEESEYADSIPGVWVHKKSKIFRDLSFSIERDGARGDLQEVSQRVRTSLVENVLPLTEFTLPGLKVSVLFVTPILSDGERPRAAYCVFHLMNLSSQRQEGALLLPKAPHFSQSESVGNPPDIRFLGGGREESQPFSLNPEGEKTLAVKLCVYGDPAQDREDMLSMINETLSYYRALTGKLEVEGDGFLGEFLQRTVHQCQQCVGMDAAGRISGSSWGTNPTTKEIWMKDMYYSLLPLVWRDRTLFQKSVEWFASWGVRPSGRLFPGGITHSLSNSLSAVLLAAQYYEAWGDAEFFKERPQLVKRLCDILDEMIASRQNPEIWLFPSVWISDGLSLGDYHTGSNIAAYAALRGFSKLLEALGREKQARDYAAVSDRVRGELLRRCVTDDGPYGPQFLEGIGQGDPELRARMKAGSLEEFQERNRGFGVQFYEFYNRDDDAPYLVHDGEETDTTLAPFYGLLNYDDPVYKNYTRFALSPENRFYCPKSRGILWEDATDSTFPGYVTGAANVTDKETYDGKDGYFNPIRCLTDLDGSIWWWPYKHKAQDHTGMRRVPGKCGWASGALYALIQNDWFGLRYDAPARTLRFSPLDFLSFSWEDLAMGEARFDIGHQAGVYTIWNKNPFSVSLDLRFFGKALDGEEAQTQRFLGRDAVRIQRDALPGERVTLRVIP